MTRAFLTYSHLDRRYAPLVKRMLSFHRVATWLDQDDIPPGSDYRQVLENAIGSADVLLVLAAQGAVSSKWVTREIATFRAVRPDGVLLPLLFEDVPLDEVFDGLGSHHAISFVDDLDAGFRVLLGHLGKEYLQPDERRTESGERRGTDRREGDRRTSRVDQRLRIGLWKEFESQTGLGKYAEFGRAVDDESGSPTTFLSFAKRLNATSGPPLDVLGATLRLANVLSRPDSELSRYRFVDVRTGEEHRPAADAVRDLSHWAYSNLEERGIETKNVYVIEELARLLMTLYSVEPRNRRTSDRRTGSDRRDDS